jgi:hypothetical protein
MPTMRSKPNLSHHAGEWEPPERSYFNNVSISTLLNFVIFAKNRASSAMHGKFKLISESEI